MTEKQILSRIIQKHDIEANWNKAVNFVPMRGELIVYDIDDTHLYERFKIGDGVTNVNDLPFTVVQPDWNQNDETALDFIKNKPDEEDALALLAEMGFVEPVVATDGSIYTDENGNIYTLI